ncbi:hypothetical protein Pfo_016224 [Paulownia fortunei]|nr:hypothetical protein Pfo_016224 [Paulownia fortunei]
MATRQSEGRKIHKVPLFLQGVKHNSDAYKPKAVSFGPYHHGKPELQLCQNAKRLTLQLFVEGSGKSPEFFKREVLKIIAGARSCYIEGSTDRYTDGEFAEMMLLDACFLIYYMDIVDTQNRRQLIVIHNYLGRLVYFLVNRDMFLLENQIPFRIVMLLINLRYDKNTGEEAVSRFLHESIWGHYKQQENQDIQQQQIRDIQLQQRQHPPLHIFEAYRRVLVWDSTPETQVQIEENEGIDLKKIHKTFRSAKDLKAKGIHFKPSDNKSLKAIKFNSFTFYGQLELPVWFVSNLSKVFFLNMIAYELSPNNLFDTTVTSYLTFMKSLIESPADVKELREKKILLTTLGSDEDVVRLFRDMHTFEMDNYSFQLEVKQKIQEHYDSKAKTWKAELIHAYLSSPWSIIAWFAGLLLLILTFLQTYFTISK